MKALTIDNSKVWTVDDYLLLGETSLPCQLIDGDLIMSPSPTPYHQLILGNLYDVLKLNAKNVGATVFFAPMDLYIDKENVLQPDLLFIAKENKDIITHRGVEGVPDLVVEIISPSNIFTDRNKKKKIYQQIGVTEFWIVDPGNKTLEIYSKGQADPDTPSLFLVGEGEVRSTVLPELTFNLQDIF
jgi:Uma2 family endonuclease